MSKSTDRKATEEDTQTADLSDGDTGTPRWVKVFGIIGIGLVLLFVILHLTGGGFGRHTPHMQHGVQQR